MKMHEVHIIMINSAKEIIAFYGTAALQCFSFRYRRSFFKVKFKYNNIFLAHLVLESSKVYFTDLLW